MNKELPRGWIWTVLRNVANIEKIIIEPDQTPDSRGFYIGLENIEKDTGRLIGDLNKEGPTKSSKYAFTSEHILYGKLRPNLNKVYLPEGKGLCSTDILTIKPNAIIERNFLGIWMRTKKFSSMASNRVSGANLPRINSQALLGLPVPLPPISTQRKIVAILDKAEETRWLRAHANEMTQKLLQSVFLEMFGDPRINEKAFPLLRINDICKEVTVGVVVKPASHYCTQGVPAFRSLNIRPNVLDTKNLVYFSEEDNCSILAKSRVNEGDILVVRTGYPGTACVVPEKFSGANCIDLIILRPNHQMVNNLFLSYILNSKYGEAQALAGNTGLAQKHLNIGRIKKMAIPLPPIQLQQQFAEKVSDVNGFGTLQEKSKSMSDALDNNLLQKAFSGVLVA